MASPGISRRTGPSSRSLLLAAVLVATTVTLTPACKVRRESVASLYGDGDGTSARREVVRGLEAEGASKPGGFMEALIDAVGRDAGAFTQLLGSDMPEGLSREQVIRALTAIKDSYVASVARTPRGQINLTHVNDVFRDAILGRETFTDANNKAGFVLFAIAMAGHDLRKFDPGKGAEEVLRRFMAQLEVENRPDNKAMEREARMERIRAAAFTGLAEGTVERAIWEGLVKEVNVEMKADGTLEAKFPSSFTSDTPGARGFAQTLVHHYFALEEMREILKDVMPESAQRDIIEIARDHNNERGSAHSFWTKSARFLGLIPAQPDQAKFYEKAATTVDRLSQAIGDFVPVEAVDDAGRKGYYSTKFAGLTTTQQAALDKIRARERAAGGVFLGDIQKYFFLFENGETFEKGIKGPQGILNATYGTVTQHIANLTMTPEFAAKDSVVVERYYKALFQLDALSRVTIDSTRVLVDGREIHSDPDLASENVEARNRARNLAMRAILALGLPEYGKFVEALGKDPYFQKTGVPERVFTEFYAREGGQMPADPAQALREYGEKIWPQENVRENVRAPSMEPLARVAADAPKAGQVFAIEARAAAGADASADSLIEEATSSEEYLRTLDTQVQDLTRDVERQRTEIATLRERARSATGEEKDRAERDLERKISDFDELERRLRDRSSELERARERARGGRG